MTEAPYMNPSDAPFIEFPKIPRLSRECVITEKIDGTSGVIYVEGRLDQGMTAEEPTGLIMAGSRHRWLSTTDDNFGFASWVFSHATQLIEALGPGRHWGEWWGHGIQRGYGLPKSVRKFSLFNTGRWNPTYSAAEVKVGPCHVVPTMYSGIFDTKVVENCLSDLKTWGSRASPGFGAPEGVVVYHTAARQFFKKTILKDEEWKGKSQ